MGRAISREGREEIRNEVKRLLANKNIDLFVGTGISGSIGAPLVADTMDKFFAIVRKPGVSSHSSEEVEGSIRNGERWAIVDDFIDSGATLARIFEAVSRYISDQFYDNETEFVGAYLYENEQFMEAEYILKFLKQKRGNGWSMVDDSAIEWLEVEVKRQQKNNTTV